MTKNIYVNIILWALSIVSLSACASFSVKDLARSDGGFDTGTCYLANGETATCYDRPLINAKPSQASDAAFDYAFGAEQWHGKTGPVIAIAAGGGGTKASAFAMGVMKRLVEEDWIEQVDIISSVSGGGHAVAFYYARADYARQNTQITGCLATNISGESAAQRRETNREQLKCLYQDLRQIQFTFPYGAGPDSQFASLKQEYTLAVPSNDLIAAGQRVSKVGNSVYNDLRVKLNGKNYNLAGACINGPDGKCQVFNIVPGPFETNWPQHNWEWRTLPEPPFKCRGLEDPATNPDLLRGPNISFTWHRCWQDMMVSYTTEIRKGKKSKGISVRGVAAGIGITILSLPRHHFANTLFDWNIQMSPAYFIQRHGNERMGLTMPVSLTPASRDYSVVCGSPYRNAPAGQKTKTMYETLDYENLRCLENDGLPMWVLNATTPTSLWFEFGRTDLTEMDKHRFEFTSSGFGSHKYGFLRNNDPERDLYKDHKFNLATAYSASYAFLDPRQRVMTSTGLYPVDAVVEIIGQVGIHAANASWDVAMPNYNIKKPERQVYHALPAPLNYYSRLDDRKFRPQIHLGDGGINRDGIGFIPLLERQVDKIIAISENGNIGALCQLNVFLESKGLQIIFGGLPYKFNDEHIPVPISRLCKKGGWKVADGAIKPQKWTKLIWRGKITPLPDTPKDGWKEIEILFINSHIYYDEQERCLVDGILKSDGGNLEALMQRSKLPGRLTSQDGVIPDNYYPYQPSLCAWMHRNMPDEGEFPAHDMFSMTGDSSQELSMAYIDLGWFIAGGLADDFKAARGD